MTDPTQVTAATADDTTGALASRTRQVDAKAMLLAIAAALLGLAIHVTDGLLSTAAMLSLSASLVFLLVVVFLRSGALRHVRTNTFRAALFTIVSLQLFAMLFRPPGATEPGLPSRLPFDCGMLAAFVALCLLTWTRDQRLVRIGKFLLFTAFLVMGVWKIRSMPVAHIDVYNFHVDAAAALLREQDPYSITFPNIYGSNPYVYAPGMILNDRLLFGFPYMPLVVLVTAPAQWLFGDFRYAYLLAMLGSGIMLIRVVPRSIGYLLAALLLFTPRSFYVLERGWTEPLSVFLLIACVLLASKQSRWTFVLFGLLIASKQYAPAMLALSPFLWNSRRSLLRNAALSMLVAAAVTLPLALWNVDTFVRSAVTLQVRQPYRPDSMSYLAWWGFGDPTYIGPAWIAFVALPSGIAIALIRLPRTAHGFCVAVAFSFFLFFAFGKQAFANYYYLVIGAICSSAALSIRESLVPPEKLHPVRSNIR